MRTNRRIWPIIRRAWISLGLLATVIFVTWSLVAYRAAPTARRAALSDSVVTVQHSGGIATYEPDRRAVREPTLVFFPGALVDPRAYAPLAKAVARAGHRTLVVSLPRRGAFGGADQTDFMMLIDSVLASLDGEIVVGGHSRGAVVAAGVAARSRASIDGLLLIGTSHPRDHDLRMVDFPVTKIVGTRDGLATPAEVRENARLLPPQTRWVWVQGGNHSQFGWYGFQPMDRRATIDATKQRRAMIDAVLRLLDDVASRKNTPPITS